MTASIRIGDRTVGAGEPAFLVAELSGNHNGDLGRAIEIVQAAAEAGADAVKLQTYTADTLTLDSNSSDFVVPGDGPWAGRTLHDLYDEAHTPWKWHEKLFSAAVDAGIQVFSTPFDASAVDFLLDLDVPAFKVASFEMVDDALLRRVAATSKPVIVSTGMASLEEITHAHRVLGEAGCEELVFLRCTSSYPAPDEAMDLASIPVLQALTGCPVGLSDHSLGTTAPVVAVALGACMIEKHVTLRRADGGVDSGFSLEPEEFAALVSDVRRAEAMMGKPRFGRGLAEEGSVVFRRSLYVVRDISAGDVFTSDNLRSIRPGYGLPPTFLDSILGRRAPCDLARGTPLTWASLLS